MEVNSLYNLDPRRLIAREAVYLNWMTDHSSEGRELYRFRFDSPVPYRIDSPVFRAARMGFVDEEWLNRTTEFIELTKSLKDGVPLQLNVLMERFMQQMHGRTGIDSSEVLLNHGAGVFHKSFGLDSDPDISFIAAVDMREGKNREYEVWSLDSEEPFGRRKWAMEQLIDSFDDWVPEEVPDPIV